jgi:hypothetical protein
MKSLVKPVSMSRQQAKLKLHQVHLHRLNQIYSYSRKYMLQAPLKGACFILKYVLSFSEYFAQDVIIDQGVFLIKYLNRLTFILEVDSGDNPSIA